MCEDFKFHTKYLGNEEGGGGASLMVLGVRCIEDLGITDAGRKPGRYRR